MSTDALLEALHKSRENAQVKHEREELSQDLAKFIPQAWKVLKPNDSFKTNWHIDAICDHLHAVSNFEINRLQIWIPPGSMKTGLVSVMWPCWEWTREPSLRYWTGSYQTDLSINSASLCLNLMQDPWFQERWGHQFEFLSTASHYFTNNKGGTRLSTSPDSKGTGYHGHRIVIDDPIRAKDADRDSIDIANDWYDSTIQSRGVMWNDKQHARVLIMQRLHQCLPPDALVRTPEGSCEISTLRAGDMVLTSAGPQPAVEVASRKHIGDLIKIRTFGSCESLEATGNHRVLTTEGWVAAEDITVKHTMVLTGPPPSESSLPSWPQNKDRLKVTSRQGTFTGARAIIPSAEKLQELADQGMTISEMAENLGYKSRGSVHNALMYRGVTRPASLVVDDSIVQDEEFWWFVGLWIAEGSVTKSRGKLSSVRLTVNVNERHFINRVAAMLERYGITVASTVVGNVIQASAFSTQLGKFLRQFGGSAREKILPEWIHHLPEEHLRQAFKGYWDGDGCLTTTKSGTHLARAASASLDLLEGWQYALIRLGVPSSVMFGRMSSVTEINGGECRQGKAWELRMNLSDAPWLDESIKPVAPRSSRVRVEGGNLLLPVKSIEVGPYDGYVWDIETPCHDFITHSHTVHNSDLAAHMLEQEDWEVLCLPERFEPNHPYAWRKDPRVEEGELLWPLMRDDSTSNALAKGMTLHRAAGQLQQRPTALEGEILKREWWQFYDPRVRDRDDWTRLPKFTTVIQTIDTPLKDKQSNDNVAAQVWGVKGADRYLLDVKLAKMNYASAKRTIREQAQWARRHWRTARHHLLIENAGYGIELITDLKRELTGVTKVSPAQDGDKVMRATTASDALESGNCFVPGFGPPWQPAYDETKTPADVAEFLQNQAAFPNGRHDDDTDAWSQAMNWLRGRNQTPMRTASAFRRRR